MARRLLILMAVMGLGALVAPAANAEFGIEKWESITCTENSDTPAVGEAPITGAPPLAKDPEQCTDATEGKHYTQAAGHPNFGITDFTLNTLAVPGAIGFPDGFVKTIVVDTPEGLSVNPEAVPQCTVKALEESACSPASQVGVNYLTVAGQSPPCTEPIPGTCVNARVALPVYNLVPFDGVPSMVGFQTSFKHEVFIVGSLDPVDQHVTFTISDIDPPAADAPPIIGSRLVFDGKAGNGTYLTMPSNCAGGQISTLFVDSQGPPFEAGVSSDEAAYETPSGATGCASVPFNPTVNVNPQGSSVDSPLATDVTVGIPFDPNEEIANSYLQTAKVVLPEGMGLNPASANGLLSCSDAQFGKGTNSPIAVPGRLEIGSVNVDTPSLPANSWGDVYVGEQKSNNPASGEQFRILVEAKSEVEGIVARLVGNVKADPVTGQLTGVFTDQIHRRVRRSRCRTGSHGPVESVKISFDLRGRNGC